MNEKEVLVHHMSELPYDVYSSSRLAQELFLDKELVREILEQLLKEKVILRLRNKKTRKWRDCYRLNLESEDYLKFLRTKKL